MSGSSGWNLAQLMSSGPSRPQNMPGMNRDNAFSRPVDPNLIQQISMGLRGWLGMSQQPGAPELPFFPPGRPLDPVAQGAAGRRFDYPTGYNYVTRPRSYEPIDFDTLRAVSDPAMGGWDLIRLAIETRKDQISKLEHSVLPRKQANEKGRPKPDDRCQQIEQLLYRPDGETPWQQWCSQLVEEHLVIDAPAILRKRSITGQTIAMEIIDGALIRPLLNYDGRRPTTGPAYQQMLKGLPAVDYTRDELLYQPRNPRVHKVYGMSCVEQIIVTINIGLRRQAGQLAYFTEGNIPDAISQLPPTWTVNQIQEFQDYWDTRVNDLVTRRKMRFVPGGVTMQMTRQEGAMVDQFDEWLARIVAYCFSLPPTPFVRMMNRATAETAYEEALSEGLQPLMAWLKGIIDYMLAAWFGWPDLELVWDDIRKVDPAEKEQRDIALQAIGAIGLDDIREDRGLEPLGVPEFVRGLGPLGFMSVEALKKAIANGWDLTGMPQPAMGGAGDMSAVPGAEQLPGADGQDPLAGLPPEILQALGVDDGTSDGTDVPLPGQGNVPGNGDGSNVVPIHRHPRVQLALAHGDQMAREHARRLAAR